MTEKVEESYGNHYCFIGFTLQGLIQIQCRNGQWVEPTDPPSCKTIDCGTPPTKEPLVPETLTPSNKMRVKYNCMWGYQYLEGSTIATCNTNLTWSLPTNMVCVIDDLGPVLTVSHESITTEIAADETLTLVCPIKGHPNPTFTWYKDGVNISDDARVVIEEEGKQLNLTKVITDDAGVYKCVGENNVEPFTASFSIELEVHSISSTPKVQLVCIKNCGNLANPMKPVAFFANCSGCTMWNHIIYNWRTFICESTTVCNTSAQGELATGTQDQFFNLDRRDDSLHYKVKLSVMATRSQYWYYNATMDVNFGAMPPDDGVCNVAPPSGFSMVTDFNISCTGFDSIPDYGFTVNYYSNMRDTVFGAILLGTSGQESMLDGVKLQEGNTDDGDSLYILVEAVYVSGAKALVTTPIQVQPFTASDAKLDDIMKELIDIDSHGEGGGVSMVDEKLENNDVNGALLGMELAISAMTSSTGSDKDTDSGEDVEVDVEKQKKVHEALTNYLHKVVHVVDNLDDLLRAANVHKKSASVLTSAKTDTGKPAPTPEPDENTELLVFEMVDKFEVVGTNSSGKQTQCAQLLLEKLGEMLYTTEGETPDYDYDAEDEDGDTHGHTEDTHGHTRDPHASEDGKLTKKERGHDRNERLISQSDKLANVLLSSMIPGEGSTVIKTPQMKMSVAKMTPGNIESPDFGDDEDACKLNLPSSMPGHEITTGIQIQALQIKRNPYVKDESAMDVNMNVLKIDIKDHLNNLLTYPDLDIPAVFNFPVKNTANVSKTYLYLNLEKTKNIINYQDDPGDALSNVKTFLLLLVPNKTTVFSVQCEIPLLMYIGEDFLNVSEKIHKEGVSYPEAVDVFRQQYSQFEDLEMIRKASYNRTGDNRIIDFSFDDSGPYYAGITVDLNRDGIINWLRSKDPECLGNDTVEDCSVILEVKISVETKSLQCLYWDTNNKVWSTKGCKVFPYTDPTTLECRCTHMTSFSGGVFVMPNMIDPFDLALFATFFENPVVVTAVIVVWMLYFFLIHWARQADKQDRLNASVLWSGDGASNSYVYLMCIATGWWTDAGTTANVFCNIQGSDGVSSHRKLTRRIRPCFQSGFDDWIVFTTKQSLGDLNLISLWHDNTGSSPHWYLKQVFVVDLKSRTSWTFIYNDWLALDRGSIRSTKASVISVTKEELSEKRGYNFNVKTTRDLRDGHLWLSIFSKPTHSTFTRVQRLTCALSLLLTTMLTNIMFYGIPTEDPEDQVGADQISFSLSAVMIGIQSSLLMFPVNLIILQLFLKAKQRPSKEPIKFEKIVEIQKHGKKPSCMNEDMVTKGGEAMGNFVLFRLRNCIRFFHIERTNVSISVVGGDGHSSCTGLPKVNLSSSSCTNQVMLLNEFKEPGKILPWWTLYITWSLVILISLTCSYFVMLYGLKYGYQRSIQWMVSFLTGFVQSALITQPLKVLIIASIITLIFKKSISFENYGPEIKVDKDEIYENAVSKPEATHVPYSEPLSSKLVAGIKERLKLEWLMYQTLRDIGLYVIYMTVVLLIVHDQRYTMEAFRNTNAIEDILVHPGCKVSVHGFHLCFYLEKVSNVDHFYHYMHEIAAPNLADMSYSDHEFATPGSSHFLLGTWRMRQLRVDKNSCYDGAQKLFKTFDMNVPECTGHYWLGVADTQSYNGSWSNKLPERPENGTQWSYQSSWQLKTIPVAAKLATYSGGGFVVTMHADHSQHSDQLAEIFDTDWIDERTRAIFLEFTLYNPNSNLFAVVMIIFEFSNNGAIIPSHQIYSAKLHHYSSDYALYKTLCEFAFLFFNIGFMVIEWNKCKVLKSEYWYNFWSYIEVIQIILSYSVIGLFFQRMLSVDSVMEDYRDSDPGAYISFYTAISWDVILGYLLAFLVAVNTMKSIKLLTFNKRAFMVGDAIAHSKGMLLSFMVLAIFLAIAFCHFAVLAFGKTLNDYKDFWSSLMSIFSFILGVSDLAGITRANRILGPVFFIFFIFIVQFCFITIFVAILNFGISESKVLYKQRKNKFELLDYVTAKCKTVFNIR